ncbi:hypothetical protein IX51_08890 [uncultured archaeon]|nr:hypothetical protein IX51_08890 [uncultured archaeon]
MALQKDSEVFLNQLVHKGFNTYYVSNQGGGKGGGTFTRNPAPLFSPYSWKYTDARSYLYKLSEFLSHEDSERINIQYEHPDLKDIISAATSTTQRAGIQLVKSKAHGPVHRHTPNSFRVVLEAPEEGAISRIDGVNLEMHPGDVIGNTNWIWHEHFNHGTSDLIWTSFLDAILVKWIGGVFYDPPKTFNGDVNFPDISQEEYVSVLGRSTLPEELGTNPNTPLQFYRFSDACKSVSALSKLKRGKERVAVEYKNPTTGGSISANQSLKLNLIPGGCLTPMTRKTENIIFLNFSGETTLELGNGEGEFVLGKYDVAVLPSWTSHRVVNNSYSDEALYFTASDAPLFKNCGLYREEIVG